MSASNEMGNLRVSQKLPEWVPIGARNYLAHTEEGAPIRVLAREAGCHASTILRRIRKIEMCRDDPLIDAALCRLGAVRAKRPTTRPRQKDTIAMAQPEMTAIPDQSTLQREALRVLRRLAETGAVLAVAPEMEKAVVVRDIAGGGSTRTAVVDSGVAQAMALKNWITSISTGRVTRYQITRAGRAKLTAMLKHPPRAANGFAEAQSGFENTGTGWQDSHDPETDAPRRQRMRYCLAESPLSALSRRKDKDGKPFLSEPLVQAGERLREDFELAQMDSKVTQNWEGFLTAGTSTGRNGAQTGDSAPQAARARVAAALAHLGPGLSDVVLRCCCYLEGLETTEKRLGWSARSGKVVLRIALIRLRRHYDETIGARGPMIG
ncbi:DUF6456 domain-containing protein [Sulfitobacter mediterraneus]|uniref:DUF6456 domain-containing protein n=1 Tax=Sulfitobacter mediterraneus TaxID=83219 RepID=UPI001E4BF8FB|nr:DUF6456 domain-containing protein [Sulfitobacter mediterraneus]MCD2359833.1 DUF6456 domain-containing protein [Sulfitobacter mediterraneus]